MKEIELGTWVTVNNEKCAYQFRRFTGNLPEWNKSLDYEVAEMLCGHKIKIPNFDRSIINIWKPTINKYCVLSEENGTYTVRILKEITSRGKYIDDKGFSWSYAYPFEFLKSLDF